MVQAPGCMACSVFQNTPAYFVKGVSYACKMFMKLVPDIKIIKPFSSSLQTAMLNKPVFDH
jgi:hypothetical protein